MIQDRFGKTLFVLGALIMILAVTLGTTIDDTANTMGLEAIKKSDSGLLVLLMVFAFGFPLGIVLLAVGAVMIGGKLFSRYTNLLVGAGILISLVVLVPMVFSRDMSATYFGAGGVTILALVVLSAWYWSQYRLNLIEKDRNVLDIKGIGYLCFALAAWNLCGFAGLPSFALYPEKMLEFGARPFAIGQLKAIMAYLVLGWAATAYGYFRAAAQVREISHRRSGAFDQKTLTRRPG